MEDTVEDKIEYTLKDTMEKTVEDRQEDGGATWDIRKSCTKTRPPWLPISSRSKATRTIVNLDGEKMGAWRPLGCSFKNSLLGYCAVSGFVIQSTSYQACH